MIPKPTSSNFLKFFSKSVAVNIPYPAKPTTSIKAEIRETSRKLARSTGKTSYCQNVKNGCRNKPPFT